MIKYIGSKRVLVPQICRIVEQLGGINTAADLFSGTSRVARAIKELGIYVTANDHNAYAYTIAKAYIAADADAVSSQAEKLINDLNHVTPEPGFFTETYCYKSRFFHPKNGARIDAIRERIAKLSLDPLIEAIALVSLMEAADRVDSTTGIQMAYLKDWAPRALKDLELRLPDLVRGTGKALMMDVQDAASVVDADIVYLDPPYNQHSYLGNYHIWETLVRWDKPEVYGKACKRVDCKNYHSPFNHKSEAFDALARLVANLHCQYILISYNNEGYINRESMEQLLKHYGYLYSVEFDYRRYIGCQIGVYNPKGEKVGSVSHVRNKETLYLVSRNRICNSDMLEER